MCVYSMVYTMCLRDVVYACVGCVCVIWCMCVCMCTLAWNAGCGICVAKAGLELLILLLPPLKL